MDARSRGTRRIRTPKPVAVRGKRPVSPRSSHQTTSSVEADTEQKRPSDVSESERAEINTSATSVEDEQERQTGMMYDLNANLGTGYGISSDKLRHPRSDAYSAEQFLLNMAQIPLGSTRLDSTHSTCRAHAFWLCRASRRAQLGNYLV